jgi:hypothetical protein
VDIDEGDQISERHEGEKGERKGGKQNIEGNKGEGR